MDWLSRLRTTNSTTNESRMEPLELAALVYLVAPVFLFVLGWCRAWVAVAIVGLLAAALAVLYRQTAAPARGTARLHWAVVMTVVAVSLMWTALGGAGHLFFANFDWYVRDAVLRDLVVSTWPVAYQGPGHESPEPYLLRAPIAYYLPTATIGKAVGLAYADTLLFLWTALGVALFLGLAIGQRPTLRTTVCVLVVFVFFSGMDLLGTVLKGGWLLASKLRMTDHLEWWAERFQYSSHTTQLFWVPNHALPGWIAIVLILRGATNASVARSVPLILAAIPLWSPLTAIGLAPFAAWAYLRQKWLDRRLGLSEVIVLTAAAATVAVVSSYILVRADTISSGVTQGHNEPWWFYAPHYLQFVLLEAGILWFLLLFVRRDAFLMIAGVSLLALPSIWFGPGNDLAMRASIPALAVLALYASSVIAHPADAPSRKVYWSIVVVLALGLPTPVMEMTRAVREPAWRPDLVHNVIDLNAGGYPAHYVARMHGSAFEWIGRKPTQLLIPAVRDAAED